MGKNKNDKYRHDNDIQDEEKVNGEEASQEAQEAGQQPEAQPEEPAADDSFEEVTAEDELRAELEKAKAQCAETNDKYVRLMAEFDNYRRRTSKEKLDMISTASKDVLVGFLPVIDDCERALKVLSESDAPKSAVEGTELIYTKLVNYLKSRGMERIEAVGKEFDTDFHEAVAQFPAPSPELKNKVIDVTQQGYALNGTVVRFAKVVVGI